MPEQFQTKLLLLYRHFCEILYAICFFVHSDEECEENILYCDAIIVVLWLLCFILLP